MSYRIESYFVNDELVPGRNGRFYSAPEWGLLNGLYDNNHHPIALSRLFDRDVEATIATGNDYRYKAIVASANKIGSISEAVRSKYTIYLAVGSF